MSRGGHSLVTRVRSRSGHGPALGPCLAAVVVALAGCGGGGKAPAVASLGPTTSTAPSTSQSPAAGTSGGSGSAGFVAFAACMNRHGVPVTVTRGPGGAGGIEIGSGSASSGIVPGSPRLQAAQRVCQKLLPGGGPKQLTPAQQAESTRSELAFAECMRKHGYPGFPDPDSQGVLNLSGIDPRSAQFQSSMKSCRPQGGVIAIRARATS